MDLVISEVIENGVSEEKETVWLKCRTATGSLIVFWGELSTPNRNIMSIKYQTLPIHVELLEPEDCIPTEFEKSEYGLSLSIPSNSSIMVKPDV